MPPVLDEPGGRVVEGVRAEETDDEAKAAQMAPEAERAVCRSAPVQLARRQGPTRGASADCLSGLHWQAVSSIAQPTFGTNSCRQGICFGKDR